MTEITDSCRDKFHKRMLSLHNRYRKKHQVSHLISITALNKLAQENAEKDASTSDENLGFCKFTLYSSFSPFLFDSGCEGSH